MKALQKHFTENFFFRNLYKNEFKIEISFYFENELNKYSNLLTK